MPHLSALPPSLRDQGATNTTQAPRREKRVVGRLCAKGRRAEGIPTMLIMTTRAVEILDLVGLRSQAEEGGGAYSPFGSYNSSIVGVFFMTSPLKSSLNVTRASLGASPLM